MTFTPITPPPATRKTPEMPEMPEMRGAPPPAGAGGAGRGRTLGDIADISTGYSFRARLRAASAGGGVAVVQMRDLRDDNTVDCANLAKTDIPAGVRPHHYARRGDIIFRSRGRAPAAVFICEAPPKGAVIAAPLLIIRVRAGGGALAEYVQWYLNQRPARAHMTRRAAGTDISMVGKRALAEVPVFLPEAAVQRAVAEVARLAARERRLLSHMAAAAARRRAGVSRELLRRAGAGAAA